MRAALVEAAAHFSYPAFDIEFDATARFGADARAFVAVANAAGRRATDGLRIALANAQLQVGLSASRGSHEPHLTLGYRAGLDDERRPVEPFRLRVEAVDLVLSRRGLSEHVHLARWSLG